MPYPGPPSPRPPRGKTQRSEAWAALTQLERSDREVDLVVVGGGINGAGIARDAARRGLSVVLVEQNDLAFGTSSRSSKLIHGGLRYLEQYRVHLVFESVSERRLLIESAPHLVVPLGFLFPVYEGDRQPLALIRAGMWIYDGLSLFRSPARHRTLSKEECKALVPGLDAEGLTGAPLYYDCATDDARLTLESAIDATRHGAIVATWTRAVGFGRGRGGRFRTVRLADAFGGGEIEIKTRAVVNATGPWGDATLKASGTKPRDAAGPLLRPTKGVHIVFDAERLPLPHAVVCRHPDDRRVLFAIPWGDRTYVGTTDTDEPSDPSEVRATRADVRYLLRSVQAYFPDRGLSESDVISTWAGLRPLISEGDPSEGGGGTSESEVSREHRILVGDGGMVTVAGGKLTTYRKMSAEVVDVVVEELENAALIQRELQDPHTDRDPLPGGVGLDDSPRAQAELVGDVADVGGLPEDVAKHLASVYGSRAREVARHAARDRSSRERIVPGRPEIFAQVDFAIEEELAATVCDVLVRRTQILLRDHAQGLDALDAVAERMCGTLGWDAARIELEKERYRHEVAMNRAWRQDP